MFEILSDRSIIHIVGLDSQKFLQSLTTNDVVNKIYTYNVIRRRKGGMNSYVENCNYL